MSTIRENYSKIASDTFIMLGGYRVTSKILSQSIDNLNNGLDLYNPWSKNTENVVVGYRSEFNKIKDILPEDYKTSINNILNTMEIIRKDNTVSNNPKTKLFVQYNLYYNFLFDMAKLDFNTYKFDLRDETKEMLIKLKGVLDTYNTLSDVLIERIVKPFYYNINTKDDPMFLKTPIPPICLLGPPGVGKTRFIKKFVETINHNKNRIEFMQINEIKHEHENIDDPEYKYTIKSFNLLTRLLYNMKKNNAMGGILFFDEIDNALKSRNKHQIIEFLLDTYSSPDEKYIHDDLLNAKIPISRTMFICASNTVLSEINKKLIPVESRMITILFPEMSNIVKEQILKNYLMEERKTTQLSQIDLDYIKDLVNHTKEHFQGIRELLIYINEYNRMSLLDSYYDDTVFNKKSDIKLPKLPTLSTLPTLNSKDSKKSSRSSRSSSDDEDFDDED